MPAIAFNGLTKKYDKKPVFESLNLHINDGDFVGLVGANGAGKTTLLKCLLDFCDPNNGDISVFGVSHNSPESRRELVFLPERFIPPYYLTGEQFLHTSLQLQGVPYDSDKVLETLARLDLDSSCLTKPTKHYSKGMAQKLGLASCFLSQKRLLILDEPMSGLDPKARAYLKDYLHTLKAEGKTVLFSTHLLHDVETLCDKIAILDHGKLCFHGSVAECCDKFNTESLEQAYLNCLN